MRDNLLDGLRVWVPRPDPMGAVTAKTIESEGGVAIRFPVIEIAPVDNYRRMDELIRNLEKVYLIIFVSVAAVEGLATRLEQLSLRLPEKLKVAVIGPSSARRCRELKIAVDFVPTGSIDSEGLLDILKNENLSNRKVSILRGREGRGLLKAELERMGAEVNYVQCYSRKQTSNSIEPVINRLRRDEIDAVVISSVSILENLIALLDAESFSLLRKVPVAAISERIKTECLNRGIGKVTVCGSLSDEDLISALSRFTRA